MEHVYYNQVTLTPSVPEKGATADNGSKMAAIGGATRVSAISVM